MDTMSEGLPTDIIIGVDTHKHTHAAVAITRLGARHADGTPQEDGGEVARILQRTYPSGQGRGW